MSNAENDTRPITPDEPLGQVLSGYAVPQLPPDFADRVVSATNDRAARLPTSRPATSRWRTVRRVGTGVLVAGALGTAAAATGVLEDLGVDLPSPQQVWSRITGNDPAPDPASTSAPAANVAPAPSGSAPVVIEGSIDTTEELEEAFRRVDEVRSTRSENRRGRVDRRIDEFIENRRAQGLPAPTPEEEQQFRERLGEFRERREDRVEGRLEERREDLRERLESGEKLTREDLLLNERGEAGERPMRRRVQRWRDMSPEQRQQRIERLRERREQQLDRQGEGLADESADALVDAPNAPIDQPE